MVVGRLLPCVIVMLAACAGGPSSLGTAPAPSAPQVADVQSAVFEVVIPKYEHPDIVYAEPLPVHLLPHHERTDAYHSVGTAFTLDGRWFVSAAHVFALEHETQFAERRLRGRDGTIYDIDQFVRHSGVRDVVVFTLRQPPAVGKPLARGAMPEIGAHVYTVGHALGEGLSVRGGNVASFSPEPLASAWNFIRYSAPASPGNSGGPLLDGHGRVVGIVVRKSSEENLNYAVPIEELDRLSATRADFHGRIIEHESGHQLIEDWTTEADLPADYATLAARGKEAHHQAFRSNRAAFEAKFRDQLFPTATELTAFLREQTAYYYPAEVVREPSGRWTIGEPKGSGYEVDGVQHLYLGKAGEVSYFVLERADDVPLATFLAEPERVIDATLRTMNVARSYAGMSIRITGYPEAHHRETWRDDLGRPWTSTTWRMFSDTSTTLHCTPYPRGLACVLRESPTTLEPTHILYAKINAPRWTLSYDGRVRDWIEFLALDPALRPTFLSGSVTLDGSRVAVSLGPVRAASSHPDYGQDSLLIADVKYTSMSPPAFGVWGLAITTKEGRGLTVRVDRVVEPLATGATSWRDHWAALVSGGAPYDGKIVRDGESSQMTIVDATAPAVLGADRNVEARAVIDCWTGDNGAVTDAALAKVCTAFRKSVEIARD